MLKKIIDFFTGKKPAPAEPVDTWQPAATAPYKVPEPIAAIPIPLTPANEPPKCGCGRSSTGFCVGLHKLSPEAWAAKQATINPGAVEITDKSAKKKRTFTRKPAEPAAVAKPKPAAIKATPKPRVKKPPQ